MIVRIMGEGQLHLDESHLDELNQLDEAVADAVLAEDEVRFERNLRTLVERVRSLGAAVSDDFLGGSDFILPDPAASLAEVRELLGEEGLIPG